MEHLFGGIRKHLEQLFICITTEIEQGINKNIR